MYSRGPVVLLSRWRIQSDQSKSAGEYSCTVNEVMFLLSTSTSNLKKINSWDICFYVHSSEIIPITDNLYILLYLTKLCCRIGKAQLESANDLKVVSQTD